MEWIWTGIIVFSLIFEFITVGDLFTIWFAAAGLITLICKWLLGETIITTTIQVIMFVILSCIALLTLRPLCIKYLKNSPNEKTNIDAMLESTVTLIESIEPNKYGTAKLNGIIYNCISINPEDTIEANTICKVVKITGNKLVVEKK